MEISFTPCHWLAGAEDPQRLKPSYCPAVTYGLKPVPIKKIGGADRDRTGDPLLAKQVLSQLSYSPACFQGFAQALRPLALLALIRRSLKQFTLPSILPEAMKWWAWVDSNYRPHPYQGCALTN